MKVFYSVLVIISISISFLSSSFAYADNDAWLIESASCELISIKMKGKKILQASNLTLNPAIQDMGKRIKSTAPILLRDSNGKSWNLDFTLIATAESDYTLSEDGELIVKKSLADKLHMRVKLSTKDYAKKIDSGEVFADVFEVIAQISADGTYMRSASGSFSLPISTQLICTVKKKNTTFGS